VFGEAENQFVPVACEVLWSIAHSAGSIANKARTRAAPWPVRPGVLLAIVRLGLEMSCTLVMDISKQLTQFKNSYMHYTTYNYKKRFLCSSDFYNPVVTISTNSFNIQQFHVQPTHCIYVFCMDLRTNGDYFPVQH
jgi:hypothetical protein